MKKYLLLLIALPSILWGQIIISPYVVFTDQQNKFGSYIVQNESLESYEISVSFVFGYPVSDSVGNVTMYYSEDPKIEEYSCVDWVRAFPRKFVLEPKQKQTVRMSVSSPDTIIDGTYWARIVTTSAPLSVASDSVGTGITAQIKFVLNQVTTLLYRKGEADTRIAVSDVKTVKDSVSIDVMVDLERLGNSPFFGNVTTTVYDSTGVKIDVHEEYLTLYHSLRKKYSFEADKFESGTYKAEVKVMFNEKVDIPESKLAPQVDVIKTVEFYIP